MVVKKLLNLFVTSTVMLAGACQIDETAGPDPNRVSYSIDGVAVAAENVIPLAVLDETKQLAGPNTGHYVEAGKPSVVAGRVLGDKLRFNVPEGLTAGTYPLRAAAFPIREHVWLGYRHSAPEQWRGYNGLVTIHELGGVGSRFVASFDSVKLSNACGDERLLEHGMIDVTVGSEDSFPVSEIEHSDDWRQLSATEQLENNLVATVDGTTYACEFARFASVDVSAEDSELDEAEAVLSVTGICSCTDARGNPLWTGSLLAYWPSKGHGTVLVDREPFYVFFLRDTAGTPTVPDDDEHWYSGRMELEYHAVGLAPRDLVDIEMLRSIDLFYVDRSGEEWTLDKSTSVAVSYLHLYGNVLP